MFGFFFKFWVKLRILFPQYPPPPSRYIPTNITICRMRLTIQDCLWICLFGRPHLGSFVNEEHLYKYDVMILTSKWYDHGGVCRWCVCIHSYMFVLKSDFHTFVLWMPFGGQFVTVGLWLLYSLTLFSAWFL